MEHSATVHRSSEKQNCIKLYASNTDNTQHLHFNSCQYQKDREPTTEDIWAPKTDQGWKTANVWQHKKSIALKNCKLIEKEMLWL